MPTSPIDLRLKIQGGSPRQAIRLSDALGPHPALEDVVQAAVAVAETLASLATRGVFHRDIKPENLFRLDGGSVIGDWGLADFPNKEDVTVTYQKLGPLYYIAPEMLLDAKSASPGPADVFSLAKTLWVLASGASHPPPGALHPEVTSHRLTSRIAHPRAH
jgi:serine/threonine protein kinase